MPTRDEVTKVVVSETAHVLLGSHYAVVVVAVAVAAAADVVVTSAY